MFRTLVAALTLEMIMLIILLVGKIPGQALLEWYRRLGTSAFAMDVLSAYVCVHASRMLTSQLYYVPFVVLAIQISHDVLFGAFVNVMSRGSMKVIDLFKDYARPAIIGYDALIVLAVLGIDIFLEMLVPENLYSIIGGISAYVSLMFVHSF